MRSQRLYAAGPFAALATAGLFYAMHALVDEDKEVNLDPTVSPRFIDFVQEPDPPLIPDTKWKVEKPELVEIEESVDIVPFEADGPIVFPIGPPPRPKRSNTGLEGIDLGASSDGDYLPWVLVQPKYPVRAQERGIEGYVMVELTVAADGTVPPESIQVVVAEPQGYFEREAIKAAAKFKYKPKIVNGVAQTVTGVRYRFSFDLED